jgi:hypothetical protein
MKIKIPDKYDVILFVDDDFSVVVGVRGDNSPFWLGEEQYADPEDDFSYPTTGLHFAKSFRNDDGILCLKLMEEIEVE